MKLVEKIARQMKADITENPYGFVVRVMQGGGLDFDDLNLESFAKSALRAMRDDPSESMCVRGGNELRAEYGTGFGVDATAQDVWQAMIDQAIKEGEQ